MSFSSILLRTSHIDRLIIFEDTITHILIWANSSQTSIKQEVWPPGSADTVCPRRPLMTQVHHFVSRIKKRLDETYRRCELMTLTFDLGGHGACGGCGSSFFIRIPSLKFVGLAIQKIGDPDLWPFDLEFDMRVAFKMGTFLPNLGRLCFGSRIVRYVRDGLTDGRTDKSKAYCPLPRLIAPFFTGAEACSWTLSER